MSMRLLLLLPLSCLLWAADSPRIAATIYPLQQLTRLVVEPGQSVDLLIDAATGCPHDHALTTAERAAVERATVVIMNGEGLDAVITRLLTPAQVAINTSAAIPEADHLSETTDHADHEGHHHGANPHFFASPRQAARIVRLMGIQLGRHDPSRAVGYDRRAQEVADRLDRLADTMQATLAPLPRKQVILQHDSLAYLARDVGLTVVGVIQTEPGQDPSAAALGALVTTARAHRAVIILEPQFPSHFGTTLAREAGSPVVTIDPVASGPVEVPLDYYERTMRANAERLVTALRSP